MTVPMQPGGYYPAAAPPEPEDPAGRLATSAKGWHSIQMALLGFIGICGVLRNAGDAPPWLQWLAAGLALVALAFAGGGIYNVGRVAYPFYGGGPMRLGGQQQLEAAGRQLRRGIRMTFLSAAAVAIAAVSGWWPNDTGVGTGGAAMAATVEVRDEAGRRFCGELVGAPDGFVRVSTAAGAIVLRLTGVASITPSDC